MNQHTDVAVLQALSTLDEKDRQIAELEERIAQREAELAAIGAGGVSLMGGGDAVVERNVSMLRSRSQVGLRKYGVALDQAGLSKPQLLQHALEEVLDLANYLQAALLTEGRHE